jgi:hypothetical protein
MCTVVDATHLPELRMSHSHMKKKVTIFVLPIFMLIWVLFTTYKKAPTYQDLAFEGKEWPKPQLVLYTSLEDSMPPAILEQLQLTNVQGIKLKDEKGDRSYFEYKANVNDLLRAFACLPFHRSELFADTSARMLTVAELQRRKEGVSESELQHASTFWDMTDGEYTAYECFKPPFRHMIIVDHQSQRILHRVEQV